jgi:hypothetical protein
MCYFMARLIFFFAEDTDTFHSQWALHQHHRTDEQIGRQQQ